MSQGRDANLHVSFLSCDQFKQLNCSNIDTALWF